MQRFNNNGIAVKHVTLCHAINLRLSVEENAKKNANLQDIGSFLVLIFCKHIRKTMFLSYLA